MGDAQLFVDVVQGEGDLLEEAPGLPFGESAVAFYPLLQVSATYILHYNAQVLQ